MKILIVDQEGFCGMAFAHRCATFGHKVRWFIMPGKGVNTTYGDGFAGIEKVQNWITHVRWADLVFVTGNAYYLPKLDRLKKEGVPYYGPSAASADLEIKRSEGMKFLEDHDIEVPPYRTFKTLQDAEKFCWKSDYRWVFKTLGDNEDKSLSYCSKNPADMISRLQRWQKTGMNPKGEVMLQEFIPGVEFGVSRWMGKEGYISDPNICWEHKKLMNKNYGPNTGEMGTVMAYVRKDKISEEILDPIEKDLVKMGHLGDMDLNCIVDEKGKVWPLEFTNRPGWPAFNIMLEQHKGDPAQWMKDAIVGKRSLSVSYDVAVGIVITQPDFPYGKRPPEELEGIPIYGINKGNQKHIYPQEVKIETHPDMEGDKVVNRPVWTTAGSYIAVVVGSGGTVKTASDRAYKTVKELSIPDMIVRTDVGEGLKEDLPKLQKHGFSLEVKYE
jgi:phosphoribosylamine---glycine ligase